MSEQYRIVIEHLDRIEVAMQASDLWQFAPPAPAAFESVAPFCVDTMNANEWLQWVFLPRMRALIHSNMALPRDFSMRPYFEEAFSSDTAFLDQLLEEISQLEKILNQS